uniref:Ribosome assembly factor mrt4 n=1 Tax=Heterorhabditis bacteriophora TaxID=37862 RepID=A0A1I7X3S8_HETBA
MPRSKREKDVSLTKVKKKTRAAKETLVDEVRHSVDAYDNIFVFTIDNMRSKRFISVRQHFKSNSRFFFGKNNVMMVALGRQLTDEYAANLHKISQQLKGQCGLMFTNLSMDEIIKYVLSFNYSLSSICLHF